MKKIQVTVYEFRGMGGNITYIAKDMVNENQLILFYEMVYEYFQTYSYDAGTKIKMIQMCRNLFNNSLKEAKNIVEDAIIGSNPDEMPDV